MARAIKVRDALRLIQQAGWNANAALSSSGVYTLQSRAGDQTIVIVATPDTRISGEVVQRMVSNPDHLANDASNG